MSIRRFLIAAGLVALLGPPVSAQPSVERPAPPPGTAGTRVVVDRTEALAMTFEAAQPGVAADLLFVEPLGSAVPVTGAPYSAEAVTETTQTLSDGNRITRRSSVQVARDGRGRERREHQAMMVGPMVAQRSVALVTISDPVAGTAVTIDHQRQVATRMRMRRWTAGEPPSGRTTMAFPPVRGAVAAVGGPTMHWTAAAGPDVVMATAAGVEPAGEQATVSLDPQTIEGVRAEGTRTTITIPAGAIGNELPIEIVSERWYSPELKTVVLSRRHDPRVGETVFRLSNVVRSEPAADLFEIPEGYRIDEPKLPPLPR